jgi:hypothetical protein
MNDLIARVKAVVLEPERALKRASSQPGDLKSVLVPYVAVLAAIGPVCEFVALGIVGRYTPAQRIFGRTIEGGFVRAPLGTFAASIVQYCVAVGFWWLLAFVLSSLATSFGGRKDLGSGYKAAAFALTPVWLAGALDLLEPIPYLSSLRWLGATVAIVYGGYLLVMAVPPLFGTPDDKKLLHAVGSYAIAIVGGIVAMAIVHPLVAALMVGMAISPP